MVPTKVSIPTHLPTYSHEKHEVGKTVIADGVSGRLIKRAEITKYYKVGTKNKYTSGKYSNKYEEVEVGKAVPSNNKINK